MLASNFEEFLAQLQTGPRTEPAADENWSALVKRISRSGQIHVIAAEDFAYWLECFPPRWLAGADDCFAEGKKTLRLFWRQGDRHFCRKLTRGETQRFCALSGVALLAVQNGGSND